MLDRLATSAEVEQERRSLVMQHADVPTYRPSQVLRVVDRLLEVMREVEELRARRGPRQPP